MDRISTFDDIKNGCYEGIFYGVEGSKARKYYQHLLNWFLQRELKKLEVDKIRKGLKGILTDHITGKQKEVDLDYRIDIRSNKYKEFVILSPIVGYESFILLMMDGMRVMVGIIRAMIYGKIYGKTETLF